MAAKYNVDIDPDSAHEMLQRKLAQAAGNTAAQPTAAASPHPADADLGEALGRAPARRSAPVARSRSRSTEKSFVEQLLASSAARQVARTAAREISRGLLGALGVK